ncbi:hypothetical protein JCM13304A_12060 [Desulfothermus okinawensis JCM 13304]
MERRFVHFHLPKKVDTISGFFELVEEKILNIDGKKLLYYLGYGAADNSCCGFFGCGYVYVVGYIKKYKALKNDEGLILSIISSIEESHRLKVEQVLKTREQVNQVVFFE